MRLCTLPHGPVAGGSIGAGSPVNGLVIGVWVENPRRTAVLRPKKNRSRATYLAGGKLHGPPKGEGEGVYVKSANVGGERCRAIYVGQS